VRELRSLTQPGSGQEAAAWRFARRARNLASSDRLAVGRLRLHEAAIQLPDARIHYNSVLPLSAGVTIVSDAEKHKYCTNKFIELANQLKDEGQDPTMVSGSLMTASGIYATYVAAGNNGALNPSGVDKVVAMYRRTLEHHQQVKSIQLGKEAGPGA